MLKIDKINKEGNVVVYFLCFLVVDGEMVDDFIFRSFFLKIVEISLLIILNVLFLIGNILVCILVYKNNRFCIIMNLYIIVLVVSDLFFVVFVMFFGIGVLIIS